MPSWLFIAPGQGKCNILQKHQRAETRRDSTQRQHQYAIEPNTPLPSSLQSPYTTLPAAWVRCLGKKVFVRESSPDPDQSSSAWDRSEDKTTRWKERGGFVRLLCCRWKPLHFDLTITEPLRGTTFGPQGAY